MICVTCGHEHNEKFCPKCGEKGEVKKLTFGLITETSISSITEMDKGFLFNLKTLFLKPGEITRDYIRGKRKGIQNPISYMVFSVSIYLIVITLLKRNVDIDDVNNFGNPDAVALGVEVGEFIRAYLKYFWMLTIFPLAASLRFIYKKYNFVEHLAVSSFIIAQSTLVALVGYLIFRFPLIFDPIVYASILFFIYRIFKDKEPTFESFLLSFSVMVIFIIQLVIIIGFIFLFKILF